jgi:hypothetical protein
MELRGSPEAESEASMDDTTILHMIGKLLNKTPAAARAWCNGVRRLRPWKGWSNQRILHALEDANGTGGPLRLPAPERASAPRCTCGAQVMAGSNTCYTCHAK